VLLSAESGWVAVPVYCGEKERWSQVHEEFRSPSAVVDQRLRKMAAGAESQGRIWGEIEGQLSGAGVSAPTRRYDEIYRDRSVNRQLDECVERFRPLPRRQSVGVVVASGGRIVGCDVFSDPDLFSRLWDKICRSYAMEVVHEGRSWSDEKWTGPGERDARTFVDRMLSASISERSTPGAGRGVRLSGSVEGGGLVWRDRCVHVAAFSSVSWLRREDR
jgi:hypothetical protein